MDPLQAQECFVFLPVTQARSSAAAAKQRWGCCAHVPVPRPLRGKGREPGPAAGRVQPTAHQRQLGGRSQPRSIPKALCRASRHPGRDGGRGVAQTPDGWADRESLGRRRGSREQCCRSRQEKGKSAPLSSACASLPIPEMCKDILPPPRADPVAGVLKVLKYQLPREVSLIFVYKGGKQKG